MEFLKNSVRLTGKLNEEIFYTRKNNGRAMARAKIATESGKDDGQNSAGGFYHLHDLIALGRTADMMKKYLSKGMMVAVEGSLSSRLVRDSTGRPQQITEILVKGFMKLRKDEKAA